jgi:hypothetical protein
MTNPPKPQHGSQRRPALYPFTAAKRVPALEDPGQIGVIFFVTQEQG